MMCLGMAIRIFGGGGVGLAVHSPPLTVIVSTKSLYAGGAEGRELVSARARFAIVAHAWLLRARAVAHVPTADAQSAAHCR